MGLEHAFDDPIQVLIRGNFDHFIKVVEMHNTHSVVICLPISAVYSHESAQVQYDSSYWQMNHIYMVMCRFPMPP